MIHCGWVYICNFGLYFLVCAWNKCFSVWVREWVVSWKLAFYCRACGVGLPDGRRIRRVGDCAVFLRSMSWSRRRSPLPTCSQHWDITPRSHCHKCLSQNTGTNMDQVSTQSPSVLWYYCTIFQCVYCIVLTVFFIVFFHFNCTIVLFFHCLHCIVLIVIFRCTIEPVCPIWTYTWQDSARTTSHYIQKITGHQLSELIELAQNWEDWRQLVVQCADPQPPD